MGTDRRPRYIHDKPDPLDPKKNVNYVDLILEDETVMSIKHEEFLEDAERVRGRIVNVKEEPWSQNQGETRKKEVDGYSLIELDYVVDLEVKGVTRTFTIELPADFDAEQRKVEVYENYVNI